MMGLGIPELLIIALIAGFGAFWIWMVVDCAVNEPEGSGKIVWILIILIGGFIGAAIYLIARRPKRIGEFGK